MLHAHDMIPKVIQYYIVHTYLYPSIDQPNRLWKPEPHWKKKTIDSTYVLLRVVI